MLYIITFHSHHRQKLFTLMASIKNVMTHTLQKMFFPNEFRLTKYALLKKWRLYPNQLLIGVLNF